MSSFYIGDTHFGHRNIITFKKNDGKPLRDFQSVEEMNEHMVMKWNSVVNERDTVYHLGDVVMSDKVLPIVARLNGRKILIKGNHDMAKLKVYATYFADVRGACCKDDFIMTHIPIHPACIERYGHNVHGHLHSASINDTRYTCVSAEQIDYTPIEHTILLQKIRG